MDREDYKLDFSLTEISHMIKILKHIQKNNLNRRIDLAKLLDSSVSGTAFSNVINNLKKEGSLTIENDGGNAFFVVDNERLRWSINHQKKLDTFRYFFKHEVKL